MNKQAFTLIELLVVVLIIGILAAVALPQYQTAVNKSRYAGLMPLARSVKDAEEEIMMTKADYTADLGDLAVTPGAIDTENTNTATHGHVTLSVVAGADAGQDYVKAVDNRNTDNTFVMYFAKSPRYAGEIHCEALTTNEKAQQLCKSYGPINTVTGTDSTFTTYVLQGSGTDAGALSSGGCGDDCWNNTVMSNSMLDKIMSKTSLFQSYHTSDLTSASIIDENTVQLPDGRRLTYDSSLNAIDITNTSQQPEYRRYLDENGSGIGIGWYNNGVWECDMGTCPGL